MLDYSASSIDESGVWRQMCGGSAAQGAVVLCCLPAVIHLHPPRFHHLPCGTGGTVVVRGRM